MRIPGTMIAAVTATPAFTQSLQETLDAVERQIVAEAIRLLSTDGVRPDNVRAVCEMLGTRPQKIEKYLSEKKNPATPPPPSSLPDDSVIYRVKRTEAFSQPLTDTIETVKEAIVYAACIRYGCDETKVRRQLRAGFERIHAAFKAAKEDLAHTGWRERR